jgi:hypothetical protein
MSTRSNESVARWTPATEQEIRTAIQDGVLAETHYVELKRQVGDSAGERNETARDLASLALDGGVMIIGVAEDKVNRTWRPDPRVHLSDKRE